MLAGVLLVRSLEAGPLRRSRRGPVAQREALDPGVGEEAEDSGLLIFVEAVDQV